MTTEKNEPEKNKPVSIISIIAVIILIVLFVILFTGALDGISNVLSDIPKWLRIILFVSISLIASGLFRNKEK